MLNRKKIIKKFNKLIFYGIVWFTLVVGIQIAGKVILSKRPEIFYLIILVLIIYAIVYLVIFINFILSKDFNKLQNTSNVNFEENLDDTQVIDIELNDLIISIKLRLEHGNFRISGLNDNGNDNILLLASRNRPSYRILGMLSQHIVISYLENINNNDIKKIYNIGIKYARKGNKIPLPVGILHAYLVFPYIITPIITEDVLQQINKAPILINYILNYPIIYELSSKKLYFYKGKIDMGVAFEKVAKDIIYTYFVGDK